MPLKFIQNKTTPVILKVTVRLKIFACEKQNSASVHRPSFEGDGESAALWRCVTPQQRLEPDANVSIASMLGFRSTTVPVLRCKTLKTLLRDHNISLAC